MVSMSLHLHLMPFGYACLYVVCSHLLSFSCWRVRNSVLGLQKCRLSCHPVCGRWAGICPLPAVFVHALTSSCPVCVCRHAFTVRVQHGFPDRTDFCLMNAPERMQKANEYFHLYLVCGCVCWDWYIILDSWGQAQNQVNILGIISLSYATWTLILKYMTAL